MCSEPPPPGPEPVPAVTPIDATPPDAVPARVHLRGHLHPAILLLQLFDAARQVVLFVVLGLLVQKIWLAVAGLAFVLRMAFAVARYVTYEYTLTDDELITREGILQRNERRIPLNRVQDLNFERSLLRRALGLSVVLVETASSKGAEARLDSLGVAEAELLREQLLSLRTQRAASGADTAGLPAAPPAPPPEYLLFQARATDLLVRGFTDLRVGALLLAAYAMVQFAQELHLDNQLQALFTNLERMLTALSIPLLTLVLIGLGVLLLLGGGLMSAIGNLIMFHGFVATLRGDSVLRRFGLLTTRSKVLPLRRVQRVLVEQNWMRRLPGRAVVRADSAGGGMDDKAEVEGGWDVVAPLCGLDTALGIVAVLLPEAAGAAPAWRPVSPRIIWRTFLRTAVPTLLVLGLLPWVGPLLLAVLVVLPLAWLQGYLAWRNYAFAMDDRLLALRWGVVGRYRSFVPIRKVQSVILHRSPLQRLLGLSTITVYVAGGSPSAMPDLWWRDAEMLRDAIAAAAIRLAAQGPPAGPGSG